MNILGNLMCAVLVKDDITFLKMALRVETECNGNLYATKSRINKSVSTSYKHIMLRNSSES